MRSYSVHEARSRFSDMFDRALAGEPQRITRHGKDAVVVVSEAEWLRRGGDAGDDLGAALRALGEAGAFSDQMLERPRWMRAEGELGADFLRTDDGSPPSR